MGKHATQPGLAGSGQRAGAWSPARTHGSRTSRRRREASALKSCIPAVSAAAGLSAAIRKRSVRCTSTSVPELLARLRAQRSDLDDEGIDHAAEHRRWRPSRASARR